jgi:predicted NBD/HSP70 family sugar kinase
MVSHDAALGIDLGGTKIEIIALDPSGGVLLRRPARRLPEDPGCGRCADRRGKAELAHGRWHRRARALW